MLHFNKTSINFEEMYPFQPIQKTINLVLHGNFFGENSKELRTVYHFRKSSP